ncbi:hypothetical protein EDC04DRAFT_2611257 [Pisolithus marmoratus]|nr:hypothetical protein EDC04DRAFT_2611257 [Pisolithus marmoratus]
MESYSRLPREWAVSCTTNNYNGLTPRQVGNVELNQRVGRRTNAEVRGPVILGNHCNNPENDFLGALLFAIVTCSQLKFSVRVFRRLDCVAAIGGIWRLSWRTPGFTDGERLVTIAVGTGTVPMVNDPRKFLKFPNLEALLPGSGRTYGSTMKTQSIIPLKVFLLLLFCGACHHDRATLVPHPMVSYGSVNHKLGNHKRKRIIHLNDQLEGDDAVEKGERGECTRPECKLRMDGLQRLAGLGLLHIHNVVSKPDHRVKQLATDETLIVHRKAAVEKTQICLSPGV